MARWGFHHLSDAEWERDQDGAGTYQASPSTLARLLLRSQASRKEKRPHPSSTQPPSLRLGYLALDRWWNPR
ncbi:MAG TPA: hypothetical protein VNW73_15855 [Ktedonobacteraceae bacterium]|nr:hypothetical protein [Ktedonobacteraceae bacterium]